VLLSAAGCGFWRTENPRVGGSIPTLATIQIGKIRRHYWCFHALAQIWWWKLKALLPVAKGGEASAGS